VTVVVPKGIPVSLTMIRLDEPSTSATPTGQRSSNGSGIGNHRHQGAGSRWEGGRITFVL